MRSLTLVFVPVLLLIAAVLPAQIATKQAPATKLAPVVASAAVKTCIVSGRALTADKSKTFEAGGRVFSTCCSGCMKKVKADPAKFAAKLDAAIISSQDATYPLTTCPISNKPLGKKAQNVVIDDTLVKVCCPGCVAKARKLGDKITKSIVSMRAEAKNGAAKQGCCCEEAKPKNGAAKAKAADAGQECCEEAKPKNGAAGQECCAEATPKNGAVKAKAGDAEQECCAEAKPKNGAAKQECCEEAKPKNGAAKQECCEEAKPKSGADLPKK